MDATTSATLPWSVLVGRRAVARVRAGYVRAGHVGGRRSRASVQRCVLCDANIGPSVAHAVQFCPTLLALRQPLLAALGWLDTPP
eukprot:9399169-Pyramimonas_sp.AAC.1